MKTFSFSKKEKLKQKIEIEKLFKHGRSITVYPLRMIYLEQSFKDESRLKVAVSVSKKLHKKAVNRNRIKRLLRESFRLNKPDYFNNKTTSVAFMILYISKEEPTFASLNAKMKALLSKFKSHTSTQ